MLAACAAQDPEEPKIPVEESDDPIDQLIADLGPLPVEAPRRTEGPPAPPVTDGDYQCVNTPIDEVRQYDQLLGQLAVGDVLWPGSMLRGDSVHSGRLTPLTLPRAPLKFSVSLESLGSGTRSATLDAPSLSSYRDAIGGILAQSLSGSTSARISAEVEEISSEKQLAVALGADVSAPLVGSVKAGFNFNDSTKRSRFVVKFFQLYYTVDVDPPNLPHDFFAASVTADDVGAVVSATNPPVYVSSIGYGRQVIFTFESDLAKSELGAALSFVYKGGAAISDTTSLTHQEVLSHTHTTAFILGGDAGEAAGVAIGNYDQLKEFVANGGNYSKDSPGAAIAYKLSYVRDHQPVQVSYASMFTQRTCSRITQKLRVVFEKIKVDNAGTDTGTVSQRFASLQLCSATFLHRCRNRALVRARIATQDDMGGRDHEVRELSRCRSCWREAAPCTLRALQFSRCVVRRWARIRGGNSVRGLRFSRRESRRPRSYEGDVSRMPVRRSVGDARFDRWLEGDRR